MNSDLALGYALGTLDKEESARAIRLLETDPMFGDDIRRAQADIETLGRGIQLVAAQSSSSPVGATRRTRLAAVLAIAAMLVGVVVFAATRGGPAPTPGPGATIAVPVPGAADLSNLVRGASLIVTGTVTGVTQGTLGEGEGGLRYQIAEIQVSETIKGSAGSRVVAFDYTYGAPWVRKGQNILLFLLGSQGTVHESVKPSHFQVLNGDAGSYQIRDGALVGASFTLDDVRRAAKN
jgi:hypothetical protein